MLFVGHTRFSLFDPGSPMWQATNGSRFDSAEAYREHLYSDARLGLRTDVFVNLSLTQLDAARGDDELWHVVSYSEDLPAVHQRSLEAAAAQFPFLVLDRRPSGSAGLDLDDFARKKLIEKHGTHVGHVFASYRLDDDDVLSTDFFDQVRPYVTAPNAGVRVSFPLGMTGFYRDGRISNLREAYWPMNSFGLLSVCRFDRDGSLVKAPSAPHTASDRVGPVILDARRPAYFWVRHVDQDTSLAHSPEAARAQVLSSMENYPAVHDKTRATSIFPSVVDRFLDESEVELVKEPHALEAELSWAFPQSVSGFSLTADVHAGDGADNNGAVMRFDLIDSTGKPVDPESEADALRSARIVSSSNLVLGFHRYLTTGPGLRTTSFSTILPDGIRCRGVAIRRWSRPELEMTVERMAVVRL